MDLLNSRESYDELLEIDKVFKATIEPWWESTYVYYLQIKEDTTWKALTPVVAAAYKYLGCDNKSIIFTNIFHTAYFSNYIHAAIGDEEEGQEHNREMQFSILIGDFLSGRLLKLLVDADNNKLMVPFAAMICTMNEGRVLKHKMKASTEQVIEKINGSLYAMIFLSAALITQKDAEFCEIYRQLGFNLGMALELSNDSASLNQAYKYLTATQGLFKQINQQYRKQNSLLENIISEISQIMADIETAAVV
ncbi:MAG TPA: hypothetical protein PKN87_00255 [Syntrophomonadaceae bacterium]|nr:hypothetical protein [Syntrophomonadaceae bacterium]HPR93620.1 hypothetical protein [Syntrophomonadaceae bacterium]